MGFWNHILGNKNKSGKDLQMIFKEIESLSLPQDMPRKIIMIRNALSLIPRKSDPTLWASLQAELGNSLYQNPQGNLGTNLEWAIKHYNLAAEVFTYDKFPVEWAMTKHNLGNAYNDRIWGNKAENIEIAIEYYYQALKVRRYKDSPMDWAMTQNNLATAYNDRIQGDRAENTEKAIEHYNQALKVFNFEDSPMDWAMTQNNLALSYYNRFLEDEAENIEQAIELYNQALKVFNFEDFPEDWAMTQNNLASAYYSRIRGDKEENIEQAIDHYNQILRVYTCDEFPADWYMTQNNLAVAYLARIRGNRAENIEQAIEHYNQALKVRTHNESPMEWAMIQNKLADTYYNRIRGDKAENIEQAIEYYNQALKVYTYDEFPVEWAVTLNNLASAYSDRLKRSKTENIEQAIVFFEQSLKVRTYNEFPVEWAMTQNNLASAYSDRIKGDKAENIEQAIELYNQALKVRSFNEFPVEWARTQNNLGNAYYNRIRGDRAENIERAIELYNQALNVYTYDEFPMEWAMTQNNLAVAYSDRIREDKTENIEQAIKYYNQAIKVRTYREFPVEWAMTQNNLASAYSDRIKGDKAENIEQAIEYYNQALKVYSYDELPVDWAISQNNLGNAYYNRIRGDKAENIEQAIEYYNQALKVRTYNEFQLDWALTQNNMAAAYSERIQGDKNENIEQAIILCLNALKIFKHESMPNDFRNTCRRLGNFYMDTCQWKDAADSYKKAIKAGNLLYSSGLSAESKTFEVGKNAHIYQNASLATYRLGLDREALLILEGGKTRLLNEALRLKMKQPEGVPKEEWTKYQQAAEKYRIAIKSSDRKDDYTHREKEVQNALEKLDASIKVVQSYYPEFQKELDISDILSIPDKETALLAFCITDKGSIGFIVGGSSSLQSLDIPNFKTEDLNNLLFKPDNQGSITGGLIGDYLAYINALGTDLQKKAFQSWQKKLNSVLSNIGAKLLNLLLSELPDKTKKLIILPSGGLFLLPLHAVPTSNGQLLCQRYTVSYAPSIQLLMDMRNSAGIVKEKGLYAVINPQEDPRLVFSGYEGQTISELFKSFLKPSQVTFGKIATKKTVLERMPERAYLHFSCHGSYNWNDPPQSGLYLVGDKTLSLADLQNDVVDISSAKLVTLSACETGITDILKGSADEFVGLPAGFMLAGVPCVISSLWSVPEISTAILMEGFYYNHIKRGMDIPLAMKEAQLWVRDLTSKQVAEYIEKCYYSSKWEGKSKEFIEQYWERYLIIAKKSPEEKPFQHPYYWAAFTVNGA